MKPAGKPFPIRAVSRRVLFVLSTIAPWLMWLDLNAMALRFVQLRGHWPMCPTNLPCSPDYFSAADSIKTIWTDPVHLFLDPYRWQENTVLVSFFVWLVLWFPVKKSLPPCLWYGLTAVFFAAWACLILDPTGAVAWYLD